MADTEYCRDCKNTTLVVFDHATGDTICLECGLVLEEHFIDEKCEWRSFDDDSNDPNRVGDPLNPLLSDTSYGLSTIIVSNNKPRNNNDSSSAATTTAGGGGGNNLLSRRCGLTNAGDESLMLIFKTIATMSERLNLVTHIKDRANEIYKKVVVGDQKKKIIKGRNRDAVSAACLFIACGQEHSTRTLNEIWTVANGVTKKSIGHEIVKIEKHLKAELGVEKEVVNAGNYVTRFCHKLGMTIQAIKATQEAVQKLEDFDIRRNPATLAAGVIFMISRLSKIDDEKKLLGDISLATGVAENTIRNACKDLHPYASRLIPEWYTTGSKAQ
ncbi:hypothetical protein AQUCO_04900040v1 [Aquilegia coerulea]|uniref:TFIIB-type domain-containing protein n=1 Tax=Aquilegia coerulea TaxID=218851 RepID=A0A2G5CJI0_AQUCA|nr:hypothetical protein AQUCO_04900040v1 [Aquilegia coerulea]